MIAYTLIGATKAVGTGDELWIVPTTGRAPRKLSDCADDPSWRPDSKALAFRGSYDGVNHAAIALISASGADRQDVMPWAGTTVPTLAWSPDRALLAVTSGFQVEHTTIVRLRDRRVVGGVPRAILPSWSPDSRLLAVVRVGNARQTLVVTTRSDSVVRTVDIGAITFPAWSHDGRLAYVGNGGIFVTGAGGSGARRLTRESGATSYFGLFWTPDSRRVEYLRCAS